MQLDTDIRRFANYDAAAQANACPEPESEPWVRGKKLTDKYRLIVIEYEDREDPCLFTDIEHMGIPDFAFDRGHGEIALAWNPEDLYK